MDYGRLLTRSFEITIRSRALWLFGILIALTGGWGNNFNFSFPGTNGDGSNRPAPSPSLPQISNQAILVIAGVAVCIAILFVLLAVILRIISRGALIGLVSELETKQVTPTVRQGFGIGSDRFMSLVGIALLINVPLTIISIVLVLVSVLPAIMAIIPLVSSAGSRPPDEMVGLVITAVFGSIGAFCCVILLLILIGFVIRPLYEYMVRVCVVERKGTVDSIREGYRLVRAHMGNTFFLYILVIGIGIAFGILMIPVVLIFLGIPALAGFLTYLATNSYGPPIVVGLVLGIPVLLVLLFISGLFQVFESTLWTEGYLSLTRPTTVAPLVPAPVADTSGPPLQTGP